MKKITLFFVSLFFISLVAAQNSDYYWKSLFDKPYNFPAIVDTFDTYIADTYPDSIPQQKLKNIKDYYRYLYYWKSRLGIVNDSISYLPYAQAAYNNSIAPYCDGTDYAQWEVLGPKNYEIQYLGLVSQVLNDPDNPNNILLSSDHGGIWRKNQDPTGNSWINVTDDLRLPGLSATEIIRNPFDHQHIIASTGSGRKGDGYGMGIIESFDNRNSWQIMEGFPYQDAPKVVKVIYDPNDDDLLDGLTLYAITLTNVYKSTNTGIDWDEFDSNGLDIPTSNHLCDIEIAGNGNIFLTTLSRWNNTEGQIYKYTNAWIEISLQTPFNLFPFQKAVISKPTSDGKIFILCDYPEELPENCVRNIYKTTNHGETWELIVTNDLIGFAGIYYSPESNNVYFTRQEFFYFKNEAPYDVFNLGWTGHADIRDIDIIGIENGYEKLLVANDGGITKMSIDLSYPYNHSAENLNGNYLPIGNFLGLGVDNSNSEFIVSGTVHNGSFKYKNDNWINFSGSDGGDCEVNWDNPDIYYYQFYNSMISNATTIYCGDDWFIGMEYELNPINPYLVYFGRARGTNGYAKLMIYNENIPGLTVKNAPIEIDQVGAIGVNTNSHIYISEYNSGNNNGTRPYRFCKSINNGQSWIDLSDKWVYYDNDAFRKTINEVLKWKTIEDIIFNPANPDELWISIGGVFVENGNATPDKFRVLHSTDAGETWNDYSEGLPVFPVMALEYHLGSINRIFAGTDCGVFYREPSMDQWECFSEGLPVSIITDLDYELNSKYLYASTYSRAIHKTPVILSDDIPLVLPENVTITWNDKRIFYHDLIIPDGTTLTITGELYFTEGTKIVVSRGGTLKIDGGTITNFRGSSWDGIELHGVSTEPQNSGNQGMVKVINNGTIENAICGIKTYKPTPSEIINYQFTGGIILATNANFKNNVTAVDILPYDFQSMNSFTNCTFEVNSDLNQGLVPEYFVKLSCIYGVEFKGCTFVSPLIGNPEDGMIGIYAINSNFWVNQISTNQKTTFENLRYGIKAIASVSGIFPTIKNSVFNNNTTGIYLGKIDNATVNLNTFQKSLYPLATDFTGLYLDECTAYQVEENQFISDLGYTTGSNYVGIVVNESGGQNEEIYKNYFENMNEGIKAQGENRNSLSHTGLSLKCNDFIDTKMDIVVLPDDSDGDLGIAKEQGSNSTIPSNMAGNLFYIHSPTPNGDYDDIDNECEHITYYYPSPATGYGEYRVRPEDYNTFTMLNYLVLFDPAWTFTDGCPSHLDPGGGGIEDLKSEITITKQQIDSTQSLLVLLIDDGNTEELQSDVEFSTPPESIDVYNDLMNQSPYLSDTVVSTAIEKETVLPNAMIRDIMVANPNTAKSNVLMNKLDERYDPLPDYMKAQILQGQSIFSIREETEADLAAFKKTKSNAFNSIIRYYRNDTLYPQASADSILIMYQNENSIWTKYALAFEYLNRYDSVNIWSTLNSIPIDFELNPDQIISHQYFEDYFEILSDLNSQEKTIFEADSTDISTLYSLLGNSTGNIKAMVRNFLVAIDTLTYNEPYYLPDILKSNEINSEYNKILNAEKPHFLNVHPNPAKDYIIIEYKLEREMPAIINITNLSGNLISTIKTLNKQDQEVVDTHDWKSGWYIATLRVKGKSIESTKFSIIK